MRIDAISAFRDNYIWVIRAPQETSATQDSAPEPCVIVDPGDAKPVLAWLQAHQCKPEAILLTHHHWDHSGGVADILAHYPCPVYSGQASDVDSVSKCLQEGEQLSLLGGDLVLEVIDCPGHTLDHIAFVNPALAFVGDTLFAAGCGRMFEGEAQQFYHSLQKIAQLPADCKIYCAHEYTAANLAFAAAVEPDNLAIQQRIATVQEQREQGQATVPSELACEHATNPFLRCHLPSVQHAAEQHSQKSLKTPADVFAVIRQWKDNF